MATQVAVVFPVIQHDFLYQTQISLFPLFIIFKFDVFDNIVIMCYIKFLISMKMQTQIRFDIDRNLAESTASEASVMPNIFQARRLKGLP